MQPTFTLSKSRLLAYRQCERRLWLEIHRHDLIRVQRKVLKEFLRSSGVADMAEVPDELLNATQRRVKHATLSGQAWFDAEGARKALAPHTGTLQFLDFEAAARPVPVWAGSRPYQQVLFQFSLHTLQADGGVGHDEFIDLSGDDPSLAFAQSLVRVCGTSGPVSRPGRQPEGASPPTGGLEASD